MQFELSSDQEFFRDTTARFLTEQVPVAEVRRLSEDPQGFGDRLLAPRRRAGLDLTAGRRGPRRRLHQRRRTRRPLPGGLRVRRATPHPARSCRPTSSPPPSARPETIATPRCSPGCSTDRGVATWCFGERRPHDRLGDVVLEIRADGDRRRARRRQAPGRVGRPRRPPPRHRAHRGRPHPGPGARGDPGDLDAAPMQGVDLTRRFSEVALRRRAGAGRTPCVGEIGGAAAPGRASAAARAWSIGDAESVGAMQVGFDMTVEWAFDRYSFGRPLASYQELKHRFADMKTWLEASHAISDAAAAAVAAPARPRRRAGQRGQGLHRAITAPSCSRTVCRSTAASASPSSTTSTSTSAGRP